MEFVLMIIIMKILIILSLETITMKKCQKDSLSKRFRLHFGLNLNVLVLYQEVCNLLIPESGTSGYHLTKNMNYQSISISKFIPICHLMIHTMSLRFGYQSNALVTN